MEELATKMSIWIMKRAEEWRSLIDDDDNEAIKDEDALIYDAVEELREWIVERMANHPMIEKAFEQARIEVRESAAENAAYCRAMNGTVDDQLRYYGMKRGDFV